MNLLSFSVPTKIIFGQGCVNQIGEHALALGAKNLLLVTDQGVHASGSLDGIKKSIENVKIKYQVIDSVEEDPPVSLIDNLVQEMEGKEVDLVVAVGGGSPTCAAKGIALVLSNGGSISDYIGGKHKHPPLPLIAVPTTAGSGTEVAPRFLLKDDLTGMKLRFGGFDCAAKLAMLDPEMLLTLPINAAISASLDALCHAVEAFTSTEANLITDTLALSAINTIYHYIGVASLTDNLEAKQKMLIASSMANIACGNAKLGLVHGMTYGPFTISHGLACGIVLPFVLDFLLPACEDKFIAMAGATSMANSGSPVKSAAEFNENIKELYRKLNLPRKLTPENVSGLTIPELVDISMQQVHLVTSGRKVSRRNLQMIYEAIFGGW